MDKDNLKKYRTVCKNCYNKKKRKNNNNTFIQNEITAAHEQRKNR